MGKGTLEIVFQKLSEAVGEEGAPQASDPAEAGRAETDEIDELRHKVLEISAPEPNSYTVA